MNFDFVVCPFSGIASAFCKSLSILLFIIYYLYWLLLFSNLITSQFDSLSHTFCFVLFNNNLWFKTSILDDILHFFPILAFIQSVLQLFLPFTCNKTTTTTTTISSTVIKMGSERIPLNYYILFCEIQNPINPKLNSFSNEILQFLLKKKEIAIDIIYDNRSYHQTNILST